MVSPRFSAGLWVFAQSEEKFGGYNRALSAREQIAAAASVPGLQGLELIAPTHVTLENASEVKGWLEDAGLQAIAVNPLLWTEPQWQRGALTSPDPAVRQQAIDTAKESIEIGHILGSKKMCLWPGEDGYDYLFQADYRQLWDLTADGVRQIAEYDPDTRIGIEYKPVEPRMHQLVSSAAQAALLGCELGLPNVGAYLDFGHAIISKETPAESVALLSRHHRLVGVHVNDNYGLGDDDIMVGAVHVWSTVEFLLALEDADYDGWISLDIVPRRESPVKASAQSIRTLENLLGLLSRLDRNALRQAQAEMDALAAQRLVQDLLAV
jgi:xylose isomerase